ncbi:hypothetical protein Pla108_14830 [Botrimarina colliarenosi]|uniref:Uncharacterized protein n=1 Tax=Botrimarina colliarenosi TaxID=2528001 RepID=A0A5C6AM88_9BACT|nr:hypothetical protein [Botrimarina colliarenosi]TWU00531.1 hypothetical protein Pla108_14830 [Botrimarina colliarenosi]
MRRPLSRFARTLTALAAACPGVALAVSTDGPATVADAIQPLSAETAEAPAPKRFDPGAMPEAEGPGTPLGYRYAELSSAESGALRRQFKLPLDALSGAKSPRDLAKRAVVAPLPDPNRPLLAVAPTGASSSDPFADAKLTSFRDDPLKALGEMLGAVEGEGVAAAETASDDPFGGDALATPAAAPAATPAAEVDEASDDPFGSDDDPFGGF